MGASLLIIPIIYNLFKLTGEYCIITEDDSKDIKIKINNTLKLANTNHLNARSINVNDEPRENIVHGHEAKLGWFPYQVILFNDPSGKSPLCGGCIIERYHVLTAAHCILRKTPVLVVAGITLLNNFGPHAQVRKSKSLIPHDKFSYNRGRHDIGLIRIEEPFYYNHNVWPIALARRPPEHRQQCVATGWGYVHPHDNKFSNVLIALTVTINDDSLCKKIDKNFYNGMICGGGVKDEGICSGDSGGPLSCDYQVHGIASHLINPNSADCAKGGADIYTKVWHYKNWIDYHLTAHRNAKDTAIKSQKPNPSLILSTVIYLDHLLIMYTKVFLASLKYNK